MFNTTLPNKITRGRILRRLGGARTRILLELQNPTKRITETNFVPDDVDRVGKALSGRQAIRAVALAKELRRGGNQFKREFHSQKKIPAQSGRTLLIPDKSIPQVGLTLGSDDQTLNHVGRMSRAWWQ